MIEVIIPKERTKLIAGLRTTFPVYMTGALDPATSSKNKADASAITVVGTDPNEHWWVPVADPFRGQPDEVADQCVMYIAKYRIRKFSIEKIAFSYLFKDLIEPKVRALGIDCQIVEYTESQRFTKHTRISRLQPPWRAGKIHLAVGLDRLEYELENYAGPDSIDHEDCLDSLVQHLEISRPADPVESVDAKYEKEIPPSKQHEQAMRSSTRLDGTWTGGRVA